MSEAKIEYKFQSIYEAFNHVLENIKQPAKSQRADVTTKNGGAYSYYYSSLEDVQRAIKTASKGTGLSYYQKPIKQGTSEVGVHTVIFHANGETIDCGEFVMTRDGSLRMSMAQAEGSVLSFCRRYTLSAIFGITSDNEDGNVDGDVQVIEHEAILLIQDYIVEVASIADVNREVISKDVLKHVEAAGFDTVDQKQRQQMIGYLKVLRMKAKAKRDKENMDSLKSDVSEE